MTHAGTGLSFGKKRHNSRGFLKVLLRAVEYNRHHRGVEWAGGLFFICSKFVESINLT